MRHILAFGDSNTWGLIPGTYPHKRYPWKVRWTSLLQEKYGDEEVRVIEEGLCGRTTVFEDALRPGRVGESSLQLVLESQTPLDAVILMLGTNDCKATYNASAYTIGRGIERCLDVVEEYVNPENILLISPISLGRDVWKPEKDPEFNGTSVETSKELKNVYRMIAKKRGVSFMAASDVVSASEIDDEHMDAEGHRIFADTVYEKLAPILAS